MSGPEHDEEDGVLQRTVSAADASPLRTPAGSSVFNWRGAGTAADAAPDTTAQTQSQPEEEETMATGKKKRAPRKTSSGSPQLQICSALLQKRPGTRRHCAGAAGPDHGADLQRAEQREVARRVAWIEKDQVYRLTKTGKDWVAAATGTEEPAAPTASKPKRKGGHRRGRTAKRKEVDTSPATDEADTTFRCAVMSDGCFFISKEGVTLELDADEHKQMLHYLERMAEPA
jgi:hypothetical protein